MSDTENNTSSENGGSSGDELRIRAHAIIEQLPLCELKAAIIALEELEVSVQVRHEWSERRSAEA